MADDKTKRSPEDAARINMHEEYEIHYWTRELGVSREALTAAVAKVGNSAAAVRKELGEG